MKHRKRPSEREVRKVVQKVLIEMVRAQLQEGKPRRQSQRSTEKKPSKDHPSSECHIVRPSSECDASVRSVTWAEFCGDELVPHPRPTISQTKLILTLPSSALFEAKVGGLVALPVCLATSCQRSRILDRTISLVSAILEILLPEKPDDTIRTIAKQKRHRHSQTRR